MWRAPIAGAALRDAHWGACDRPVHAGPAGHRLKMAQIVRHPDLIRGSGETVTLPNQHGTFM